MQQKGSTNPSGQQTQPTAPGAPGRKVPVVVLPVAQSRPTAAQLEHPSPDEQHKARLAHDENPVTGIRGGAGIDPSRQEASMIVQNSTASPAMFGRVLDGGAPAQPVV